MTCHPCTSAGHTPAVVTHWGPLEPLMGLVWPQPIPPGGALLCPLHGGSLVPRAMPGWQPQYGHTWNSRRMVEMLVSLARLVRTSSCGKEEEMGSIGA